MPKFVMLWTDVAIWLLVISMVAYALMVRRKPNLAANWAKVFHSGPALASFVVLVACLLVTLADSLHYRALLPAAAGTAQQAVAYDSKVNSVLDALLRTVVQSRETTYSVPMSCVSLSKESAEVGGKITRVAPRLKFACAHLADPARDKAGDVAWRAAVGGLLGGLAALGLCAILVAQVAKGLKQSWGVTAQQVAHGQTRTPWHVACITLLAQGVATGIVVALMNRYHVFGTDITGNDVLFKTLKSIRTAFVIGTLATIATLPLAVVLGIMAGYFKGWVDELIQYIYTVLSSIPNILLIAACVLMVQVFLDKHPELFETGLERADLKLFLLCTVLGLTGWAGLCRLLRGETLKLRELEYVQAANAFGVSHTRIMIRHIFPNVAHLMLIVTVLEFSALILYEAVLSFVGVGVDPSMNSFGGMINFARDEMSRDPVVWWPFAAAFFFMVSLVLAANLFSDGVRDAFDPRARSFRPRVLKPKAAPQNKPA